MRRLLACVAIAGLLTGCTPDSKKPTEPQWHDAKGVLDGKMVECRLITERHIGAVSARVKNLSNNFLKARGQINVVLTDTGGGKVSEAYPFEHSMAAQRVQVIAKVIEPSSGQLPWTKITCKLEFLEYKAE